MRAIQMDAFGGPDVMELREVPVPEPGPGQARLRVAYVGMNPFDAMARAGKITFMPISFPFTPGLEHSGIVDAVGKGVDETLIGKRVISRADFGAYADYSIVTAKALLMLDDRIDLKTGCVYRGCSTTAWHALYKAGRLQSGETCLLHSAAGPMPEPVDIPTLIFKNVSVAGMNLAPIEDPPGSRSARTIIDSVATGVWKVPITEDVALEDVADLHRRLESRQVKGRAVIRVGGDLDVSG